MDPVTQAALGAVVAQSAAHRELGFKAAAWGALAGAMPDVDVFFNLGGDYFSQLEIHRGFTHSLFFAPLVGPALGLAIWRWERWREMRPVRRRRLALWILAMTLAIWSHPMLDLLTPYGTQLLSPFSDRRFAINAMPIIDPVYTLVLLIGLLVIPRLKDRLHIERAALGVLSLSSCYLAFGGYLNDAARDEGARQLRARGLTSFEIEAFPTIFQIHYRRLVARTDDHDWVGYVSMWNTCEIEWRGARRATKSVGDAVRSTREGRVFEWFAMGWTHHQLRRTDGGLSIRTADLRYGTNTDPQHSLFMLDTLITASGASSRPGFGDGPRAESPRDAVSSMFAAAFDVECPVEAYALVDVGESLDR